MTDYLGYKLIRILLLFGIVLALGCGGKETARISGIVKYQDGSPIVGAVKIINFQPTSNTSASVVKAASSRIDEDGRFDLMTRKKGDGVYCGQYDIYFTILSDPNDPFSSLVLPKYSGLEASPFDVIDVSQDRDDLVFVLEKQ